MSGMSIFIVFFVMVGSPFIPVSGGIPGGGLKSIFRATGPANKLPFSSAFPGQVPGKPVAFSAFLAHQGTRRRFDTLPFAWITLFTV